MDEQQKKLKVEELLTRGVENVFPNVDFLRALLMSDKKLTLYTGYDPTAPSLHLGNGLTMLKLRQFQDLGHKVIMLIGDFTAMIGDPTDKSAARRKLTPEEVKVNWQNYKAQAAHILRFDGDNPVEVKFNSEWLAKLSFADVVELASHFTVQRMMERDMFEKRWESGQPIYVHEFMYPLMQGYDSVAMNVDGEIGGNDQTFNMLAGRHLMQDFKQKEKFVLTIKLLADNTGKKMSKSEGNTIAMDDSPEDMFGKVMSWPDEMIINSFVLCTTIPMDEIKKMEQAMADGANPRDYKIKLAQAITAAFLGAEAAAKGYEYFTTVFQSKELPDDIAEFVVDSEGVIEALLVSGAVATKSDARRQIDQGGVKINGEIVTDYEAKLPTGEDKILLQKGKRFFAYIKQK
ncbi:MAG TPA: tyrosine--tRNA ligase [bacterium]|nr:tyrosine--tRNA ligase [bacterium]